MPSFPFLLQKIILRDDFRFFRTFVIFSTTENFTDFADQIKNASCICELPVSSSLHVTSFASGRFYVFDSGKHRNMSLVERVVCRIASVFHPAFGVKFHYVARATTLEKQQKIRRTLRQVLEPVARSNLKVKLSSQLERMVSLPRNSKWKKSKFGNLAVLQS